MGGIVMSSICLYEQVKRMVETPREVAEPSLPTPMATPRGVVHPDLRDCLLQVVSVRAQLQARDDHISKLEGELEAVQAEVVCCCLGVGV